MSPEATEMKNETSGNKTLELNNNIYGNTVKESSTEVVEPRKLKTIPEVIKKKVFSEDGTDSSLSSDSSDSAGVEHCVAVVAQSPGDEVFRLSTGGTKSDSEKDVQEGLARQFRSMSEGAVVTHNLTSDGDVSVFPNLRDNVLETMGLLPDSERKERLTDEEIEEKFKMLTLTFAIDAVTLAHRRELQRRQRDQAEENLASEVKRIAQAVRRLHPLCVDAETAELVTSLLSQLDVIVKASSRVATSAEVFGSVQQEWRLAESVNLMLSHLRNLCQQRDTARRQLECTQLMLQKTATSSEPTSPGARTRITSTSGRIVTRRRASIATIPRPVDASRSPGPTAAALIDGVNPRRVTTRRTTCCGELSPSILRGARPSRLDFSLELVKIREGRSETQNSFDDSENEIEFQTPSAVSDMSFTEENLDRSRSSSFGIPDFNISIQDGLINNVLKSHLRRLLRDIATVLNTFWTYLLEHGTINAICCLGIIFCFGMGTIILGSLMLEIEFGFHGLPVTRIPWRWYTWRELLTPFFNRDPGNENLPHM